MRRVFEIVRRMYGLFLLYFMVVILLTFVIFMATFDFADHYYDSKEYYNYNFSSWFRIFVTLMIGITSNNTPDMAIGDYEMMPVYVTFYVILTSFNLLMANGIIIAIIN